MSSEQKIHDEDRMVRYLLGELAGEEHVQFEEACFEDDQRFEELLAIEAELTDDYVRRDLVGLRRERLERHLLNTPEGRFEVEFAKLITGPNARARAPQAAAVVINRRRSGWRSWFNFHGRALQVSLAALALILVGLGLWFFWSSPQARLQREEAARQRAPAGIQQPSPKALDQLPLPGPSPGDHLAKTTPERPQQSNMPLGKTSPTREAPSIISLLLVPGFDRSAGGANDLVISPGAQTVRLQLSLESNNYRSYGAVLRSVEGKEILNRRGLQARSTRSGSTVTLELSARAFPEGDFILTLSGTTPQGGVEDLSKYFLSIRKK